MEAAKIYESRVKQRILELLPKIIPISIWKRKKDMTADELLRDYFNTYMKRAFFVVDEMSRLLGLVTLARLLAVPETNLSKVKAEEVMIHRSDLVIVNASMTAESSLMQMTQKHMDKIFVCEEEIDKLVKMVSKTDILNVEVEIQEIA